MNKIETSHKLGKSHKAKALMPRNLKSQGMSINVIIIAAIALIVLVVLVAVFTGRFGIFAGGVRQTGDPTKSCTTNDQGFSVQEVSTRCPDGSSLVLGKVATPGNVCCTG